MAFQGNLREFSATEILQLIGSQKKSGALVLESQGRQMRVHVLEGRIISTRLGGAALDDPLLVFLRRVRRLSDEQVQGVLSIHRESRRDLEDILVNGRYMDAEELAGFVERQMLEDLTALSEWQQGTYRFEPEVRWAQPPLVRMSSEGSLIEAARRADEGHRFRERFKDRNEIPGVRDMPNPDVEIAGDETEMFSVIDGHRTVAEVVAAAALSDYEALEALQRMIEAGWIQIVGRRDDGAGSPAPAAAPAFAGARPAARPRPRVSAPREVLVGAAVLALLVGLRFAAGALNATARTAEADPVFAAAQVRDVRFALELYRRERGRYPGVLDELVADRWLDSTQLVVAGQPLRYRSIPQRGDYELTLPEPR